MRKGNRKRAVSALLVTCMLTMLFLSSSGAMTVEASGLVDDTVDGVNLYSKYSIFNYHLDYYVDLSWIWTADMLEAFGNAICQAVYLFTDVIWQLSTFLSHGTGYAVQEAYKLDFVGDMADAIGKNMQSLAGVSKSGVARNGFYPGFLRFIILVVGVYVAYVGLIKRETSKAISAVINMLVIFVITTGIIVYAPELVKNINEFSSDVSTAALELGTELVMPGNDEMGDDAVDKVRNTLFSIQIYKPWLLLQFGTLNEEEIGTERIETILSISPLGTTAVDRINAVKADVETYENGYMTVTNVGSRLGMVLLIFIINLIISIFVLLMSGMMILTQILFLIYAMFLVVSFILSMFPTYNGLAKKSVMKVFNIIMMRAGIILAVTVAFSISAMLYSMSGEYPFFMTSFLQIVVFAGVYLKLNDILGMLTLQDADGNGKRRGNLLRSAGRYMIIRNMFGKYRRRTSGGGHGGTSGGGRGEASGGGHGGTSGGGRGRTSGDERGETSGSGHEGASGGASESGSGGTAGSTTGKTTQEQTETKERRNRQEHAQEETGQGYAGGQNPETGARRETGVQDAAGAVQKKRREPENRTSEGVSGEKSANKENGGSVSNRAFRRWRRHESTYNAQEATETEKKSETMETAREYKGRKSVWWSAKQNDAGKPDSVSDQAGKLKKSGNGAPEPAKRESLASGKVRRTANPGVQGTTGQTASRAEHAGNRTGDTGTEQNKGRTEGSSNHGVSERRNMSEGRRDSQTVARAQSVVHERVPGDVRENRMPEQTSGWTSGEERMPKHPSGQTSSEERMSRETDGNLPGSAHISKQAKEKEITESHGMRQAERRTEQKQVTVEAKEVTEDKAGGR